MYQFCRILLYYTLLTFWYIAFFFNYNLNLSPIHQEQGHTESSVLDETLKLTQVQQVQNKENFLPSWCNDKRKISIRKKWRVWGIFYHRQKQVRQQIGFPFCGTCANFGYGITSRNTLTKLIKLFLAVHFTLKS